MNKDNETPGQLGITVLHDYGMVLPIDYYVTTTDPNWKSQKTRRKNWRRLSNAPKAVRKRMGFREGRHA